MSLEICVHRLSVSAMMGVNIECNVNKQEIWPVPKEPTIFNTVLCSKVCFPWFYHLVDPVWYIDPNPSRQAALDTCQRCCVLCRGTLFYSEACRDSSWSCAHRLSYASPSHFSVLMLMSPAYDQTLAQDVPQWATASKMVKGRQFMASFCNLVLILSTLHCLSAHFLSQWGMGSCILVSWQYHGSDEPSPLEGILLTVMWFMD